MTSSIHNLRYPRHIPLDERGRVVQLLIVREQPLNIVDAVGKSRLLHRAIALSIADNLHLSLVGQNVLVLANLSILIEYVMLHFRFLLGSCFVSSVVFSICRRKSLADESIDNLLLFIGKSVKHIRDGFSAVVCLTVLVCVSDFLFYLLFLNFFLGHFRVLLFQIFAMLELQEFTCKDDGGFIRIVRMLDYGIDERTGISTGKNEANLSNYTMKNISAILLKLISHNRKRRNIAMVYEKLRDLTGFGVVKLTICVNTFGTILEKGMTQNIVRIVVIVVPNKRNRLAIAILERIATDGPTIRTLEIVSGSPTREIKLLHFDLPPPFVSHSNYSSSSSTDTSLPT